MTMNICIHICLCVCDYVLLCLCIQSVAVTNSVLSATRAVTNTLASVAVNATSPDDSATSAWWVVLFTYLLTYILNAPLDHPCSTASHLIYLSLIHI